MADTNWQVQAACRDTDPELFFPEPTDEPLVRVQVAAAKAVCRDCPVRERCLAEALERLPHGIAGGLTEQERRGVRAARGVSGAGGAGGDRRPRWRVLLDAGTPIGEVAWECGVSVRTVERWAASIRREQTASTRTLSSARVAGGSR